MNVPSKPSQPSPALTINPGMEPDGEGSCPMREVLDRIGDTWSVLVIINLTAQPLRFNALRRTIEGISQRMLTVTLRSLERDGLVRRTVRPTTPPEVEYALTELGLSLAGPLGALGNWAAANRCVMRQARETFDKKDQLDGRAEPVAPVQSKLPDFGIR
jgi:DNA-binding HxlR family transcriptional regulator